jgi:hypothetical protein
MATIRFVYKPSGLQGGPQAINNNAAAAEGVAAGERVAASELRPVKVDRWWRESSFDLWQGLEVREDPPDTMPAQWLDEAGAPPGKR